MATLQTQPQMYPTVAHLQALFAAFRVRSELFDLAQMFAGLHGPPPDVRDFCRRYRGTLDHALRRPFDDLRGSEVTFAKFAAALPKISETGPIPLNYPLPGWVLLTQ